MSFGSKVGTVENGYREEGWHGWAGEGLRALLSDGLRGDQITSLSSDLVDRM